MTLLQKSLAASALVLALALLAGMDAAFMGRLTVLPREEEVALDTEPADPDSTEEPENSGGGVAKSSGPKVETVLLTLGVEVKDEQEPSLIRRVLPKTIEVSGSALLKDDDRIGALAWAESKEVKTFFLALKEALHASFTPQVRDLVDETHRREGKPVRNFLTFLDPGIAPERLVFVRVRERVYEFHITEGKDDAMFELIEALTD